MKRLAMAVEYDGTRYLGWQTQAQQPTVQQTLEQAVSTVADTSIEIHGAGRTDTGVHATAMVCHFDTTVVRGLRSWILGTNANLPEDVAVTWITEVSEDFHARYSATERRYCYRICNRWIRPVNDRHNRAWIRQPLDIDRMNRAVACLIGEHDFTSFRAVACQARHAVRTVLSASFRQSGHLIEFDISGNAFLHHMVRNIVGSLVEIGRGDRDVDWLESVLEACDRTVAGMTAPACGLTLESVVYPAQFSLPDRIIEIGQ